MDSHVDLEGMFSKESLEANTALLFLGSIGIVGFLMLPIVSPRIHQKSTNFTLKVLHFQMHHFKMILDVGFVEKSHSTDITRKILDPGVCQLVPGHHTLCFKRASTERAREYSLDLVFGRWLSGESRSNWNLKVVVDNIEAIHVLEQAGDIFFHLGFLAARTGWI